MTRLLLAAAIALAASSASAQQMRCGNRDSMVEHLARKYGETPRSIGFQQGRGLVEQFANAETGTWTILVTTPQGMSCLMAAGSNWRAIEAAVAGDPT